MFAIIVAARASEKICGFCLSLLFFFFVVRFLFECVNHSSTLHRSQTRPAAAYRPTCLPPPPSPAAAAVARRRHRRHTTRRADRERRWRVVRLVAATQVHTSSALTQRVHMRRFQTAASHLALMINARARAPLTVTRAHRWPQHSRFFYSSLIFWWSLFGCEHSLPSFFLGAADGMCVR